MTQFDQEAVLELEYVLAAPPPEPALSIPHDDWLSSIAAISTEDGFVYATGCYDSQGTGPTKALFS